MQKRNRTQLVLGVLLILVAGWLIATRINPELNDIVRFPPFDWPMWVVLAGAMLLVLGLLVGAPGMAVPACIVAGIGGILYYQNATGNWEIVGLHVGSHSRFCGDRQHPGRPSG